MRYEIEVTLRWLVASCGVQPAIALNKRPDFLRRDRPLALVVSHELFPSSKCKGYVPEITRRIDLTV